MHYILFMMLLTTAPGQSIAKSKRVYALQTTQAIEFEDIDACTIARNDIEESISKTDTVVMVSTCYPKGSNEAAATALGPKVTIPDHNATPMAVPNSPPTPTPTPSPTPDSNKKPPLIRHFNTFGGRQQ
jgi:hypothetical protein